MQEEVTGKAVAIIIDGAKISEHTLEKALKAFLEAQKNKGAKIHRGKQSLKQLAGPLIRHRNRACVSAGR